MFRSTEQQRLRSEVSGSDDSLIMFWDVATLQHVATLHGHESYVLSLAVLDADRLASGAADCREGSALASSDVGTLKPASGGREGTMLDR